LPCAPSLPRALPMSLLPSGAALAELGPVAYGLFVAQVLLALSALAIELVKVAYARAERAALRRNAFALLTAHEERRRAIEARDEDRKGTRLNSSHQI